MPAGRPRKPVGPRQGHRTQDALVLVPSPRRRPIPRPPDGLLLSSRKAWRVYWQSDVARVADPVDLPRIERWIRTLDQYDRVSAILRQTLLVHGSTQQPVLNPLASYVAMLAAELRAAEYELGLTPLARLRLGIILGQARLTAEELNRALDQRLEQPREVEPWAAEWEDA